MDLLQDCKDFIDREKLFSPHDRLLLAVSGGLDSSVLCELCHRAGYHFAIAHCNFQLRGTESERDEEFVRNLAKHYQKPFHVIRFDTQQYAAIAKVSIQVAARKLRYDWFNSILEQWGLEAGQHAGNTARRPYNVWALTAHHLDDNVETLLMNFFKGTGIAGLRAMLPKQGKIVRPLLFASRTILQEFATAQGLQWIEDSSNSSDKYTRNRIRHQLIPRIEECLPGSIHNLSENISRFREIEMLYRRSVDTQLQRLLHAKGTETHIPVLLLRQSAPLATLVFELARPFGFSPRQTPEIIALLDSTPGRYVLSPTHRILKDRNWLIISPLHEQETGHILIESPDATVRYEQGELRMQLLALPASAYTNPGPLNPTASLSPSAPSTSTTPASVNAASGSPKPTTPSDLIQTLSQTSPGIAFLDARSITFPLLLRKWRPGDYFYPLGLRKKKKLNRFFIDNKLSLADKEKVWVLEMDKKIIWVIGLRIDDRFRLTPATTQILRIESLTKPR